MASSRSFQAGLLAVLAGSVALSYVDAPYPADLSLHHAGTAAGLALLVWTMWRAPLSNASFARLVAFLLLHVVAAHWLYSFVPYDRWTESLFGVNVTQTFGFERNHFDRVVHLGFGALVVGPVREVLTVRAGLRPLWARALSVDIVLSTSAVYEVFEWLLTVAANPVHAERYNGQQGDVFDPQKDMAIAAAGAVTATLAEWAMSRRSQSGTRMPSMSAE